MTIRRCGGEKIHTVHAERDLVANWEVDLSEKLQEYLLKICSGELAGDHVGDGKVPVNFAEAALLLQGSVQVYSKKVEYLYNLVLRTLEFLSKQREKEQSEDTVNEGEESSSPRVDDDENDLFWNVDNITVDAKNSLDNSVVGDSCPSQFVKPPANLGVLKGDCLDTMGEGGELGSYLLATTHLYRDFILLDPSPCDVLAVNEFLGDNSAGYRKNSGYNGSSVHKSFHSLQGRSGGSARSHRSSTGKNQGADSQNCGQVSEPHPVFGEKGRGFNVDAEHGGAMGLSDTDPDEDDNPPKPLSAYESGNLKVKPFKIVKTFREVGWSVTIDHMASMVPLATEFNGVWEKWRCASKDEREEEDIPCFEKLRALLVNGGNQPFDSNGNHKDADKDNHKEADGDDHEHAFMDEDGLRMNGGGAAEFHNHGGFGKDESYCQESLEDLCQSHLDAILANIAKSEKQTDLSARVSSWKQKVEQNLEEQELHTPFDIKEYGETIINKLTVEESGNVETFTDLMKDQEKHNVARAFSALLQLVNNGDVELEKPGNSVGEPVCYTSANPFGVRLLNRKAKKIAMDLPRKRAKSPITEAKPHESPPRKKPNTCSVSRQTRKVSLKISKI